MTIALRARTAGGAVEAMCGEATGAEAAVEAFADVAGPAASAPAHAATATASAAATVARDARRGGLLHSSFGFRSIPRV
jgi:hypothetical protein